MYLTLLAIFLMLYDPLNFKGVAEFLVSIDIITEFVKFLAIAIKDEEEVER